MKTEGGLLRLPGVEPRSADGLVSLLAIRRVDAALSIRFPDRLIFRLSTCGGLTMALQELEAPALDNSPRAL
jgi:hypothetical protein